MENGNTALQVHRETSMGMSLPAWQALKDQATVLVKSGFLPVAINTPEKAIAVAVAGKEIGIGMMEAFRSINVIQGKICISPQLMLALANRTGQLEDQKIVPEDDKCTVTIKRKGRQPYSNEFGVKEATEMGLIGKDNYKKQKKVMFQWRAIAANLRVSFPDVVLGMYTPEELGANVTVGENEEMIVQVQEPLQVIETKTLPQADPSPTTGTDYDVEGNSLKSEIETLVITPDNVLAKEYAPGKNRYGIRDVEGLWFSTFDKKFYDIAFDAKGNGSQITVSFKTELAKNGKLYRNLTDMRVEK